jgi:hypothetical protein
MPTDVQGGKNITPIGITGVNTSNVPTTPVNSDAGGLFVRIKDSTSTDVGTPSNPLYTANIITSYSGTIASIGDLISAGTLSKYSGVFVQIYGTFVANIDFLGSEDGTNFSPVTAINVSNLAALPSSRIAAPGIYYIPVTFTNLRVNVGTGQYTSGTLSCVAQVSSASPTFVLNDSMLNGTALSTTLNVSNTAQQCKVGTSNLLNRKSLIIQSQGTNLSWGFTSGSQPFLLPNGTTMIFPFGSNVSVWVIRSTAATVPVAIGELA